MLNPSVSFSVVIVNYRSADRVRVAARSLPEPWSREIIVVNNDPRESRKLECYGLEGGFRVFEAGGNVGFGAAANIGARRASGRFLLFLNPDTLWQWGTFSEIADFFGRHPKVAVVGPRLVGGDGCPERWSCGMPVSLFGILWNNLRLTRRNPLWESDRAIGVGWVSGAAMIIRRDVFERIDGFDEDYFLYFEDVDLCDRVRKTGRNVALYPFVAIRHDSGTSFADRLEQKAIFYRSQGIYFLKHRPRWEVRTLAFLRGIIHALRLGNPV